MEERLDCNRSKTHKQDLALFAWESTVLNKVDGPTFLYIISVGMAGKKRWLDYRTPKDINVTS